MRTVLPRREDLSGDRGVLIVAYASHKKKAYSFFLLQVGLAGGGAAARWGAVALVELARCNRMPGVALPATLQCLFRVSWLRMCCYRAVP